MKKITDYAELVKAKHALNKTIAPVEDGANIAGSYTSGKQFIRGGVLYTALTTIAENTAWSSLTLDTDYELADDLTSQLASLNQTLTNKVTDISDEIADMNNVLGAKNILPTTAKTQTLSGVTFTANADGTVTVSGTATNTVYYGVQYQGFKLPNKRLILSGCPSGGSASTYELQVRSTEAEPSQWQMIIDHGDSQSFVADNNRVYACYIGVMQGQTVSNLVFKPMIRLATDSDTTYQPYSMTNQELTPIAQAVSNRNLLDNPWFSVNQRGQSSYLTTAGFQYTLDRWFCYYADTQITINSDGSITVGEGPSSSRYEYLRQKLEIDLSNKLKGKTLTLSVIDGDGKLWKGTESVPSEITTQASVILIDIIDNNSNYVGRVSCDTHSDGYLHVNIVSTTGHTLTVKAIKLELGSVSTLAQDTAPNYATELLKCQRYFWRRLSSTAPEFGYVNTAGNIRVGIRLPVAMRAIPTMTSITGASVLEQCGIYGNGRAITPSAVSLAQDLQSIKDGIALVESTFSDANLDANNVAGQRFNIDIDFFADL